MRRLRWVGVLVVLLGVPLLARAGQPEQACAAGGACSGGKPCSDGACDSPKRYKVWPLPQLLNAGCGCEDDYCRKPLPCEPPCIACGCEDNYCRKPLPCEPPYALCGGEDNYCRKPLPCLPSCAVGGPGYSCGAAQTTEGPKGGCGK